MSQLSGPACAWSSLWRCLGPLLRPRQTTKPLKQIAKRHGVDQVGYCPFSLPHNIQNQTLPMYHSLCSASFSPLHVCTNFQAYSRTPTCAQIQPEGFLELRLLLPGQHWLSSTAWATQTLCRLRQKFPSCIQPPDVTCLGKCCPCISLELNSRGIWWQWSVWALHARLCLSNQFWHDLSLASETNQWGHLNFRTCFSKVSTRDQVFSKFP